MNDVKTWAQSKTVWAAILAIIAQVLQLLKFTVTPELLQAISDWLLSLITLISAAVALFSRLRATKQIVPASQLPSLAWLALLPALLLVGGCGVTAAAPDYVAADRSTFEAVAPEYAAYVGQDPLLAPEQKQRRQNTLDVWRMRIEHAEAAATTQPASR